MGSTMMQQADLQREDVAKGRPSSVSKTQVAFTGAALMIPGSQALSACNLLEIFNEAKDVEFGEIAIKEDLSSFPSGRTTFVGYKNQPQLIFSHIYPHGTIDDSVMIHHSHYPSGLDKPPKTLSYWGCSAKQCDLLDALKSANIMEALRKLRKETSTTLPEPSPTKPETSTTKPEASTANPAASPTNPAASDANPAASDANPAAGPTNPAASPTNPAASNTKPAASTANPAASPTNPAAGPTKPAAETSPAKHKTTSNSTKSTPKIESKNGSLDKNSNKNENKLDQKLADVPKSWCSQLKSKFQQCCRRG